MLSPLLIFGASARAAAQSALRAGCRRAWAADLFADADLRACAEVVQARDYPRGLEAAIEQAPDGPWMYTGALENHPRLVDRLARLRPLLGCPGSVLRRVRDPRQLAEAVRSAGLAFPETRFDGFPADEKGRWLCKPFRSAGGTRVRAAKPSDNRPRRRRTSYFQRLVDGLPASAVFIGDRNRAVLFGVTRQLIGCTWCGARGFQYAGSIGPVTLDERRTSELTQLGDTLAERFGLVGLFGVDLLLTEERLTVLEANPRYTASVEVLERALDISTITWHVAACRAGGLPSPPEQTPRTIVGKAVLFARDALTVTTENSESWLAESLHDSPAPLADIPLAGTQIEPGHPVFTIFAQGANVAGVEQQLRGIAGRQLAALSSSTSDA